MDYSKNLKRRNREGKARFDNLEYDLERLEDMERDDLKTRYEDLERYLERLKNPTQKETELKSDKPKGKTDVEAIESNSFYRKVTTEPDRKYENLKNIKEPYIQWKKFITQPQHFFVPFLVL
jgi:hypothetical protein